MNIELQKKLYERFKFLKDSKNNDSYERYPFQMFAIECGDGWYKLLYKLFEKIESKLKIWKIINLKNEKFSKNLIIKKYKLPFNYQLVYVDTSKDFIVTQIKEKFGGLRLYTAYYNNKIEKIIYKSIYKSYKICENCGKPGKPNKEGWISVRCKKCRKSK